MLISIRVLALVAVSLLSGCAGTLRSDISAFHRLGQAEGPATQGSAPRFAVVPVDSEQAQSLEFQSYAALVSEQLRARRWIEVPLDEASLRVSFRYGSGTAQSVLIGDASSGFYGSYGVWSRTGPGFPRGSAVGMGFPIGAFPRDLPRDVRVIYLRELSLRVERAAVGGNSPSPVPERVYEATVRSQGNSSSLATVMPAMIRALFADFPGPSGVERSVEVLLKSPG